MKNIRKTLAMLLALAMMLALCACGAQAQPAPAQTEAPAEQTEAAFRTVTDAVGRTVEVPVTIERIVPLGNTPRMISYLGLADKVVGIGECEIASSPIQAYAYPHIEFWSTLPNCGTDAMGETAYYAEEIILCAPDVILCTYTADVADNIQNQTGIPTVAVAQGTLFGEDYNQSLRIIGEVCGASDKAEALIAFIGDCLADLTARTADIPDDNKPLVLGAGATFKGGHSIDGVYLSYPVFSVIAANDAAADAASNDGMMATVVDREQILQWDPDIIFFDAGNMGIVNADFAEAPDYFNQLKAVQNGQLYQWPNSTWHWSNYEIPLVSAYFTGAMLYPEAFADVDFEAKAAEIFDMFIGCPDYLSVLEAAGCGYAQVTLGE